LETINRIYSNHAAQVGGIFIGLITYLVEPTAAFYALWIAVVLDLVSRLFAEAKNQKKGQMEFRYHIMLQKVNLTPSKIKQDLYRKEKFYGYTVGAKPKLPGW
jgi:hypothetical protein